MTRYTLRAWGQPVARLAALAALAWLALAAGGAWGQARFSVSADGAEVTDARTGLVWRRCSAGQVFDGSACTGTAATYTHEQALTYAKGQTGWRLPNVKELSSIVDSERAHPSIDPVAFPATPAWYYWSSSPLAGFPGYAWVVYFDYGVVNGSSRNYTYRVRLVR